MAEWLFENWVMLAIILLFLVVGVYMLGGYLLLPSNIQSEKIRTWLLWAVVEAEKALQGGTGRLKLVKVYDMFKTKFPIIAQIMPYTTFELLVEDALAEMKHLIKTNPQILKYIFGGDGNDIQDDLRHKEQE